MAPCVCGGMWVKLSVSAVADYRPECVRLGPIAKARKNVPCRALLNHLHNNRPDGKAALAFAAVKIALPL